MKGQLELGFFRPIKVYEKLKILFECIKTKYVAKIIGRK